jgi:2,3-bisphosphoglycerate-dependent phosphoglycerate mutase
LTDRGRAQVRVLADRLAETGELAGADVLYSSVLPRAVETAALLAPALGGAQGDVMEVIQECAFCELHPGTADGLDWSEFSTRFGNPDWDAEPDREIAPGGESWTGFVRRVADALDVVAARHPGGLVVVACHAGVIESSLLSKLPIIAGTNGARLKLRTQHASLTTWEVVDGQWKLLGYNDGAHHLEVGAVGGGPGATTESGRSWMGVGTGAGSGPD